jgi:hypothetical protein
MVKEWTPASANSPAIRATLRACLNDDRSNVSVIVRFALRKYLIVNFVLARVGARLRARRTDLRDRRVGGGGEISVL